MPRSFNGGTMKISTTIHLTAVLALGFAAHSSTGKGVGRSNSFLPENTRNYPADTNIEGGGITQAEFNQVLDKVKAYYAPVIKKQGRSLYISRRWNDGTVNASAMQILWYDVINMYGGLARHPMMTPDGFMLVACHETGHHIGGAPKIDWASNEGQSDYFGTLQCLKNILGTEDNVAYMQGKTVDPFAAARCQRVYSSAKDQALCERISMAGYVLGSVLGDLSGTGVVNFATPDTSVVSETDDEHPAAQCRLDTYFAGALCNVSPTAALSDTDTKAGVCFEGDGHEFGSRPRCWFNPASPAAKNNQTAQGIRY